MAASGADVGDALAPLVEAFDLSLLAEEAGLRLRTAPAEGAAPIGSDDLCRSVNGRALDGFEHSGGAADSVPATLSVRYHDPARDYQAGVQRIGRPGPGRLEQGMDLPMVLSGEEARLLAARKLGGGSCRTPSSPYTTTCDRVSNRVTQAMRKGGVRAQGATSFAIPEHCN